VSATLAVLGAGSIQPRAGYGSAGYALCERPGGEVTLLDCGPGSIRMLGALGIGLLDVRRVVLSHYHLDHCLDLFALSFARHNPSLGPLPELELFGPVGLARLVGEAPRALGRWANDPRARLHEIRLDPRGRGGFAAGGLRFTCAANGHCPEAVSWRVELADGSSLAYTGDTGISPAVAELARGVDVLLSECSFPDGAGTDNHLTPRSAGELAAAALPGKLVLTHFYPALDPELARVGAGARFDGRIELARDGSRHSIP
jgi:ribonuclease BN (tRNA processing enzyme)